MQSPPEAPGPEGEVTLLLRRWTGGEEGAVDELLPLVYQELRRLASRYLRDERPDHTLEPAALVHEAYLRLVGTDPGDATIEDRQHFFAVAARAMRRILVEHARRHAAARRPSPRGKVPLEELGTLDALDALGVLDQAGSEPVLEVLAVHEGLERLRGEHPRKADVVELRYFGALSESEVAEALGISRASVARDWRVARLLLADHLTARAG